MKIKTTRAEAFSDGVIAIIITIMALELLPQFESGESNQEILDHLQRLLPNIFAYVLSFVMLGIFWMNHHHLFHLLHKLDEALLILNLFTLFWLSLIPMVTAILGANPFREVSVIIYAAVMLMCTISFTLMRYEVSKRNLLHRDRDQRLDAQIKEATTRSRMKGIAAISAYALAIPLSFLSVYVSFVCFVIPPALFFIPDGIDDERLAEKVSDKN